MPTKYRVIERGYISFPVQKLVPGSRLLFDIYADDNGMKRRLFNKGSIISDAALSIVKAQGFTEIYAVHEGLKDLVSIAVHPELKKKSVFDDPAAFSNYSFRKETHHLIDRALLKAGMKVPFSIYSLGLLNFKQIIEASESSPAIIDEKILANPGDFMITEDSVPLYREYLRSLEETSSAVPAEGSRIKSITLKENSKIVVKQLFDNNHLGENLKEAKGAVCSMVDLIFADRDAIYDLMSLKNYDYYTYSHSVNVGVLSIGLGIAAGMKRDALFRLGLGAILHDIGKRVIQQDIINKQGRLNEMEYQVIKTHVVEGEKILRENRAIPEESFAAMMHHHEKLSGRGYPFGLKGNDIELFGKITAIVDCYDALTTARPYKAALTPFQALALITNETGDYDPWLLKGFIKMLGKPSADRSLSGIQRNVNSGAAPL